MRNLYLQDLGTQRQPMTPAARNTGATRAEERRPLASWRPTATPISFVNATLLREGTEEVKFHNGKFTVPETMVPRILELYHDSPHSGGHDGFWRTYQKIRQRF